MKDILKIRQELSQFIAEHNNDLTNEAVIKKSLQAEELIAEIK